MESLLEFAKALKCPLCSEPFKCASTFSTCGHTFCYECVISRIEGPGINTSQCPTCKQPGWKKDLRTNHQINNALEHVNALLKLAPTITNPVPETQKRIIIQQSSDPRNQLIENDQEHNNNNTHSPPPSPSIDLFTTQWREHQLKLPAISHNDQSQIKALAHEIALLESAINLCDVMPCKKTMPTSAPHNNNDNEHTYRTIPMHHHEDIDMNDDDKENSISFRPSQRKLSGLGSKTIPIAKTTTTATTATTTSTRDNSDSHRECRAKRKDVTNQTTTSMTATHENTMHEKTHTTTTTTTTIKGSDRSHRMNKKRKAAEWKDIDTTNPHDHLHPPVAATIATAATNNKNSKTPPSGPVLVPGSTAIIPDSQDDGGTLAKTKSRVAMTSEAAFVTASQVHHQQLSSCLKERNDSHDDTNMKSNGDDYYENNNNDDKNNNKNITKNNIDAPTKPVQMTTAREPVPRENAATTTMIQQSNIKSLLFSKQDKAAAPQNHPIYIHFNPSDNQISKKARMFREKAPNRIQLVPEFNNTVTHLIVETNEYGFAPRTRRYLTGLARRCWLLSDAWLEACIEKGEMVRESGYVVKGCVLKDGKTVSGEGIPAKCRKRAAKGEPGLFHGCSFLLMRFKDSRKEALMKNLIAEAQGVVIHSPEGGVERRKEYIVLTDDSIVGRGMRQRGYSRVMSYEWVLDSLTQGVCIGGDDSVKYSL